MQPKHIVFLCYSNFKTQSEEMFPSSLSNVVHSLRKKTRWIYASNVLTFPFIYFAIHSHYCWMSHLNWNKHFLRDVLAYKWETSIKFHSKCRWFWLILYYHFWMEFLQTTNDISNIFRSWFILYKSRPNCPMDFHTRIGVVIMVVRLVLVIRQIDFMNMIHWHCIRPCKVP